MAIQARRVELSEMPGDVGERTDPGQQLLPPFPTQRPALYEVEGDIGPRFGEPEGQVHPLLGYRVDEQHPGARRLSAIPLGTDERWNHHGLDSGDRGHAGRVELRIGD